MTSTSSPFSLFRLPHVVLSEVFNSTTPDEIIRISLCSKRAARVIKYTSSKWKKTKWLELILQETQPSVVKYEEFSLLSISHISEVEDQRQLESLKIGESTVPVDTSNMVTYWKDKLKGVRSVMEYVMDIFNSEIETFDITEDATSSEIHYIFQWMAKRKTVFSVCILNLNNVTTDDLNFFFRNIQFNETVCLEGFLLPKSYRYQRNSFWTFPRGLINAHNGSWMRMSHLLRMNCLNITVMDVPFTNKEINCFLKKWQAGEACPLLNYLHFGFTKLLNLEEIIEGLDGIKVPGDVIREYKIGMYPGKNIPFPGGYNIKRNDGTMATVCIFTFPQIPQTHLKIAVSPELAS
ncbi:hypothetical protein GCK72_009169 [Caenorhabditis remanei]|uniref:F-box domain-containing protein n=1 Tax=Caenorhabditis remanei TaxID=31234 RepID=A0A6A5H268_CAERE|nr:hypothetical protein GCK72_009169 [Caenorhabditis remanei]KAF1760916.1 hypothetical protein GCK72_009169 [Caenorhabditis remanei]